MNKKKLIEIIIFPFYLKVKCLCTFLFFFQDSSYPTDCLNYEQDNLKFVHLQKFSSFLCQIKSILEKKWNLGKSFYDSFSAKLKYC